MGSAPLEDLLVDTTTVFTADVYDYLSRLPKFVLATATKGGTYYPVGIAIAALINVKLGPKTDIGLSAIPSAGSGENIGLLREKQVQFAILQGLYGAWAWSGEGQMSAEGPQKHLRSITMLWQNVEHFVVASDRVKTGTIDDLGAFDGAKFSIGRRNSGTEGSGREILSNLGIDPDGTFDLVHLGYGASAEALQNGTIEGMNIPAGPPVAAISQAYAAMGADGLKVLDFTDEQMAQANGEYELWTRFVIPAGTYPGQQQPINTIAQPNFLAVHQDVPEETVYQITKTLYENLPFLNNIHRATEAMGLNRAIAGLPVPLHPGAARYYREHHGLDIPARMLTRQ
ncbi:MAG: TAXI family TRAP transporter solute-binding subunit [Candidatus Competibacterales bacterium]